MDDRSFAWLLLGFFIVVAAVASAIDIDNPESIPPRLEGLNPTPPPDGPLQRAVTSVAGSTYLALLAVASAVAFGLVLWRTDLDLHQRNSMTVLAVLVAGAFLISLGDLVNPDDPGFERRDLFQVPLLMTLLFYAVIGGTIVRVPMDGFGLGSMLVVGILQLFVLWGWTVIPGGRTYVLHAYVTIAMALLLASVLLFHQLQQPRPRRPKGGAAPGLKSGKA